MAWYTEFDNWMDIIGLAGGAWSANEQSKNAMSMRDLKDLYLYQNSSDNNPFFQSELTEDGQGGTVRNTQFTPAIQHLFEQMIGRANESPDIYSSNNDGLMNAQSNYQRSRYGLDPEPIPDSFSPGRSGDYPEIETPDYGPGRNGTNDQTRPDVGGLGSRGPVARDDGVFPGGSRPGQPTDWWFGGNRNMGPSLPGGDNLGWQGDEGLTGWDSFDNSGFNPFAWRDNWNGSDIDNLFGQSDIGSLGGLDSNRGIGSAFGALAGVPGAGKLIAMMLGENYDQNKNYFSPTDPNDPYGQNNDPTGLFGQDDQLPNSPAAPGRPRRPGFGYGDGRPGSITGGGGYNYATRLRPRGDPRTIPLPKPDKIGGR